MGSLRLCATARISNFFFFFCFVTCAHCVELAACAKPYWNWRWEETRRKNQKICVCIPLESFLCEHERVFAPHRIHLLLLLHCSGCRLLCSHIPRSCVYGVYTTKANANGDACRSVAIQCVAVREYKCHDPEKWWLIRRSSVENVLGLCPLHHYELICKISFFFWWKQMK